MSVFRLEKTQHCAGVPAAVEQTSLGVLVVEEVGDDDGSHGRLLSLAVMLSLYAATRTAKNFFLYGAPRCAFSPQTSYTKIFIWFPSSMNCGSPPQHLSATTCVDKRRYKSVSDRRYSVIP